MVATEVHNLIEVSLGKIAKCKQQKSGINLRRNLLVASVIHKARVIYVSELQTLRQGQASRKSKTLRPKKETPLKNIDNSDSREEPSADTEIQTNSMPSKGRLQSSQSESCDVTKSKSAAHRMRLKRPRSIEADSDIESEDDGDSPAPPSPSKRGRSTKQPCDSISESAPSESNSDSESAQIRSLVNVFNSSLPSVGQSSAEAKSLQPSTAPSGLSIAMEA